ncbi:MAG: VanZ family protein [Saprospiraceae bacterium]|nr:VanZ family protein [Saprospiraceae bacterium]
MKPYLPAILWALVILGLSISPTVQLPETILAPDKIGHLVVYGVLNWLVLRALHTTDSFSVGRALWSLLVVSLYGVALEFVQWAFFPNRFFEVWDMVANATGAVLSYFLFKVVVLNRSAKRH